MREPTIRKQNIHRNHLKIRLIFFGILALALVIASYFSEYLCPYDPYLQDLGNAKAVRGSECFVPGREHGSIRF